MFELLEFDGTFRVIFLVLGLWDMGANYCGQEGGCLAKQPAEQRISISGGPSVFQDEVIGQNAMIRYEPGHQFGPFGLAMGMSVSNEGDIWAGIGPTWTREFLGGAGYFELAILPGYHAQAGGPELGSWLLYRSSAEIGVEMRNGVRVGLFMDHRSNNAASSHNPGVETVQLKVSIPLD